MTRGWSTVCLVLWLIGPAAGEAAPVPRQSSRSDIVVYGATAGGVMAAVAAAREGATVALLEPGRDIGGMVSGGLGWTDMEAPHRR